MTMTTDLINKIAQAYLMHDQQQTSPPAVQSYYPEITLAEGYQIQQAIVQAWETDGYQIIGKKNGFTSTGAQQKFGLTEPVYGHLGSQHRLPSGTEVPADQLINPRLESEIAFKIGQTLTGPAIGVAEILAATEWVAPAFELVDFRIPDQLPSKFEASAYNVFLKHVILSDQTTAVAGLDLPNLKAILYRNGDVVSTGTGAAVLGNPAISLAWLVNKLAEHGRSLEAGEIVITGSFTPLQSIAAGEAYTVEFEQLGSVSVTFT